MKYGVLHVPVLVTIGFALTGFSLLWSGGGFDGRNVAGGDPILAQPNSLCFEDPKCSTVVCASFTMDSCNSGVETVRIGSGPTANCFFYEDETLSCKWDGAVETQNCARISNRCEKVEITPNHFICTSVAVPMYFHSGKECWTAPFH
jgi:hypothetical protein